MGHPVLAVIAYTETVDQAVYPQPLRGTGPCAFALWEEERLVHSTRATAVEVLRLTQGRWEQNATLKGVDIHVAVTTARTVLACRNFDKGGGWIGTPGAMLLFNAGSMLAAAARRHGKILTGQLRHEWLREVSYHGRQQPGWSQPGLTLAWTDGDGPAALRLTLHGSATDPRHAADAIVAAASADRQRRGVPMPAWPGLTGFRVTASGPQQGGTAVIPCPTPATPPSPVSTIQ